MLEGEICLQGNILLTNICEKFSVENCAFTARCSKFPLEKQRRKGNNE